MTLSDTQVKYLEWKVDKLSKDIQANATDLAKVIALGSELSAAETILKLHHMELLTNGTGR